MGSIFSVIAILDVGGDIHPFRDLVISFFRDQDCTWRHFSSCISCADPENLYKEVQGIIRFARWGGGSKAYLVFVYYVIFIYVYKHSRKGISILSCMLHVGVFCDIMSES